MMPKFTDMHRLEVGKATEQAALRKYKHSTYSNIRYMCAIGVIVIVH